MEKIMCGDVEAQLATLTTHMRDVLRLVHAGEYTYGRGVAQVLGVPYPQAYNTLHTLSARGFIAPQETWSPGGIRKTYTLTEDGARLLTLANEIPALEKPRNNRKAERVNPEHYVQRMRLGPVYRWLIRHNVIGSYEELMHVVSCGECNQAMAEHGMSGDVRCAEAARKVNDKEWT